MDREDRARVGGAGGEDSVGGSGGEEHWSSSATGTGFAYAKAVRGPSSPRVAQVVRMTQNARVARFVRITQKAKLSRRPVPAARVARFVRMTRSKGFRGLSLGLRRFAF